MTPCGGHGTASANDLTQRRCNVQAHTGLHLTGASPANAALIVASSPGQELRRDAHRGPCGGAPGASPTGPAGVRHTTSFTHACVADADHERRTCTFDCFTSQQVLPRELAPERMMGHVQRLVFPDLSQEVPKTSGSTCLGGCDPCIDTTHTRSVAALGRQRGTPQSASGA